MQQSTKDGTIHPEIVSMKSRFDAYKVKKEQLLQVSSFTNATPFQDLSEEEKENVQISSIIREEIASENPDKFILYPHFNHQDYNADLEKLKGKLDLSKWDIKAAESVGNPSQCSSSIRIFNGDYQPQAADIQGKLNQEFGEASRYGRFEFIDLTGWAERNSIRVPPRQLEVWFVDIEQCEAAKRTAESN